MSTGSPPPKGFRGVLKGVARRMKKIFNARAPATESGMSAPLPQPSLGIPSSQLAPTHEQLPQPTTQQSVISPQPVPSTSQPTPSAPLLAPEVIQSANADSGPSKAVKKAGADTWLGLKTALQALEKSDVFLPLKPAVAGVLEVVDTFKVGGFISFVPP